MLRRTVCGENYAKFIQLFFYFVFIFFDSNFPRPLIFGTVAFNYFLPFNLCCYTLYIYIYHFFLAMSSIRQFMLFQQLNLVGRFSCLKENALPL